MSKGYVDIRVIFVGIILILGIITYCLAVGAVQRIVERNNSIVNYLERR